ncbi:MAG TPA: helix-turn-helix transcriptional regulator [Alphaproteobacteria bacterium]|nr:helix-turn-helix transcriptional regulator [Alphaproteobacteria bacterium]
MRPFRELHEEMMRDDPAYRREYEAATAELAEEFTAADLAASLKAARKRAGLTQKDLARAMSTKQGAISRLERGDQMASIATLQAYAKATGNRLRIVLEPRAEDETPAV